MFSLDLVAVVVVDVTGRVGMDANRQMRTIAVRHAVDYGVNDPIADSRCRVRAAQFYR